MAGKTITIKEAATRLGLATSDLLALIRSGRLAAVQVDGVLRVQVCDVEVLAGAASVPRGPFGLTDLPSSEFGVPTFNLDEFQVDLEVLKLVLVRARV